MTPSDDTPCPRRVRSRRGPRQVRRGAGQAHDGGPRGPLRPARRRAVRGVHEGPLHPVRRARRAHRGRRRRDHRCGDVGGHRRGEAARAGPAQGRPHRQGRWDRRHVVLEPVPGGDVRRRVVHLHAHARGDELHPEHPLRVRRRDPAAPRRDRHQVRPGRRCPVPHGGPDQRMGRRVVTLDHPHRPRRRDPGQVPDHGARDPQPDEAPGDPGDGRVRGHGVPHRALGLRVHRRRPRRPAPHQARRQGRRRRGRGRERHPGGATARRVGEARLRVPAHAVGDR